MWGEESNVYRILISEDERKSPLGKPRILKSYDGKKWTGFIRLRIGTMSFCEHVNASSLLSG
jgi:hypothetical protein